MRKFNLARPLLLLAVAFFANFLAKTVCILLGTSANMANNLGFIAMIVAAILVYKRLRVRRK